MFESQFFSEVADQFLLRSDMTFLNNGSFGACPRPVFEQYQAWQRELEDQPVEFLGRRLKGLLQDAREPFAPFLGVQRDDFVFVPNATMGTNIVARSLDLQPGDEVLTTNCEYGAADRTWHFVCQERGATYINQPITMPTTDEDTFVTQLWAGVTEHTKVIFLSHITAPTGMIFPIAAVAQRARQEGILTIIDGAHAPGQVSLDLTAMNVDFYTGNFHKWLLAPKGCAFLYARPEVQSLLKPLVVSWGYESITPDVSRFQDYFGWVGTQDAAAFLTAPAALAFYQEHDWLQVRARCHAALSQAMPTLTALTGQPFLHPDTPNWYSQMLAVPLPPGDTISIRKNRLWDEYRIEIPIVEWNGMQILRISLQGFNSYHDIERLLEVLPLVLK